MTPAEAQREPEQVGRYAIFDPIAQGGMAKVHLARLSGPEGFSRVVAVKRMHGHVLADPELRGMFVAEARLAARVRHPNVVPILDVLVQGDELMIVMEYVHGESLQALLTTLRQAKRAIPLPIVAAIMVAALQGLHAAHEARDENGEPLDIVHRDVSPHNVLVGADGVSRVLDFGVAKAMQATDTKPELLKGKFSYMAPEVIRGGAATRQADIFSAATLLWELLVGRRLFGGTTERERLLAILDGKYPSPREFDPSIPEALEGAVMRGICPDPRKRYTTALELAIDLERVVAPASQRVVGEWVSELAAETLNARAELIQQIETSSVVVARSSFAPPGMWSAAPVTSDRTLKPAADPAANRRRVWLAVAALSLVAALGAAAFAGREPPAPVASLPAQSRTVPVSAALPEKPLPPPPEPAPLPVDVAPEPVSTPTETEAPVAEVEPSPAPEPVPPRVRRAGGALRAAPKQRPGYAKDFFPDEL